MNSSKNSLFAGLCLMALVAISTVLACAQGEPMKPKPPMYSYVSNWQIPRGHWAEMKTYEESGNAVMDKAMADGTLVGHGTDMNLVHSADGWTHDDWFSSMSMAGIIKVLDQLYSSGGAAGTALESATKHYDLLFVSRYYNWKPGAYKDGVVQVSTFRLKKSAPDGAFNAISGEIVAPLLEKMLADGMILEYEIDTEAVHTTAPGSFSIVTVSAHPDDADKMDDMIRAAFKAHPIDGVAFDALIEEGASRDEMGLGQGVFK